MLGTALSESTYDHNRMEGIQLLAIAENIDKSHLKIFSEVLLVEHNEYVRSFAAQALNNPEFFYANQEALDMLSYVLVLDVDDGVRGEA